MDINKEILKSIVDNSPNYTEKQKLDIKAIIEKSNTEQEALEKLLIYFSAIN